MQSLEISAVILITLCSLAGILIEDIRFGIGLLALQYVCVFIIVSRHISNMLTIILIFSGLMVVVMLGMTLTNHPFQRDQPSEETKHEPQIPRLFPFLASVIVLLFIFSTLNRVEQWIPSLERQQSWAALVLLGLNSLKLAFNPFLASTIHSLLSIFQGFVILITAVTSSMVAVGLVAVSTLVIGFICAYLLVTSSAAET